MKNWRGSLTVCPRSVWNGIRAMKRRPRHPWPAHWALKWLKRGHGGFWLHAWTPEWHEGRGPYLSMGLGKLGIYRGY